MATYLGLDIFELEPREVIAEDIRNDYFVRGQVWQKQDKVVREKTERSIEYVLIQRNQAERATLRQFFDSKLGRVTPFWVKSYITDYRTKVLAITGEDSITVKTEFGIAELLLLTRHVFIPVTNDFRRIAGVATGTTKDELVIILDSGISADLPPNSAIQNLYFSRFETDNLDIETNGLSHRPVTTTSLVRFRELQKETPDA